jgi:hypothetical protein
MKKAILLHVLFLLVMSSTAQENIDENDTIVEHPLDFSTKGIYFSAGYIGSSFNFDNEINDTIYGTPFHSGLHSQLHIEFENNLAFEAECAYIPQFNHSKTWLRNTKTIIGVNAHFPWYIKGRNHHGMYTDFGGSFEILKGYFTYSDDWHLQSRFKPNSNYGFAYMNCDFGIGYEYKLKYLQFFSMFKFRFTYMNEGSDYYTAHIATTADFITGVKAKLPSFAPKPTSHMNMRFL